MIHFKLHPYTTIVFEETTLYSGLGDSMICAREMVMHKAVLTAVVPYTVHSMANAHGYGAKDYSL